MHQENLLAFGYALEHAGHQPSLEKQDITRKWKRKRQEFRPRIKARDPEYMPNPEWLPALSFLFPEVGAKIKLFIEAPLRPSG